MAIPAGSDLFSANTTVAHAEARCAASALCRGFTFNPPPNASNALSTPGIFHVYFKSTNAVVPDASWQSYLKPTVAPRLPNATRLSHPRPIFRGGKTGSGRSGLLAVAATDEVGDTSLNIFGVGRNFVWTADFLQSFESNPLLGTGDSPAFGRPGLPIGGGGIGLVEMFHGPDGLLHGVGCSTDAAVTARPKPHAASCHHYVSGDDKGESVGVQWYGPVGSPLKSWPTGGAAPIGPDVNGGYPGDAVSRGDGGGGGAGTTTAALRTAITSVDGALIYVNITWVPVGPPLPGPVDPRHIHLAIADPSSMSVMWATWNDTAKSAAEFCAVAGAAVATAGRSHRFLMDLDKPMGVAQFEHVVVLTGLAPGSAYWYRVGSASDGWSRWVKFVMPGAAGKPTAFLALADLGADETVGGQTTAFTALARCFPAAATSRSSYVNAWLVCHHGFGRGGHLGDFHSCRARRARSSFREHVVNPRVSPDRGGRA